LRFLAWERPLIYREPFFALPQLQFSLALPALD